MSFFEKYKPDIIKEHICSFSKFVINVKEAWSPCVAWWRFRVLPDSSKLNLYLWSYDFALVPYASRFNISSCLVWLKGGSWQVHFKCSRTAWFEKDTSYDQLSTRHRIILLTAKKETWYTASENFGIELLIPCSFWAVDLNRFLFLSFLRLLY